MIMNKKIIIASDIFPPDIGGPATYSVNLAGELKKRGWKVKVICYSDKPQKNGLDFSVVRIIRSKNKIWTYFKYFVRLFFMSFGADVIYAMGPVASGYPTALVKKLTGKKMAVKVVGDYAWEQARNKGDISIGIDEFQKTNFGGRIGKLRNIQKFVCQGANIIIVPSEYLKKIVAGWDIDKNKIKVIYNSITISKQKEENIKEKANNNLIVSVGRLVPWKGFEALIEIMPELLKTNPDFKLKIYGGGPDDKKLNKLIDKLKLQNSVKINQISHNELMEELKKADMFVLNTGYEGLPHTVLEAMSCNVPVITTDICGNPEIVKNGKNGLLVEYNNKKQLKEAIIRLYKNLELRQNLAIAGKKSVGEKFSYEFMIDKIENLLKQL